MADQNEFQTATPHGGSAAEAIAFGAAAQLDPRAAAYLEEQTRLARLQSQNLIELNAFELSHLKWRRFNDQMKGALQVLLVALGALIVAGFAFMIWNAADSGGLEIAPFAVPPDLAARGLAGQVVAAKVLDRLSALDAGTDSQRNPKTYSNDWGNDLKVQIPETGISIGELDRFLRDKLGHTAHIGGEIVRTPQGLSLTARADTGGSATVSGSDAQLDGLIESLAESVFRITQPYRYGAYMSEHGQRAKGLAAFIALAKHGPPGEQAWGYLGWGNQLELTEGIRARLAVMRFIAGRWPDMYLARQDAAMIEYDYGRPEASIAEFRIAAPLLDTADHGGVRPDAVANARNRIKSFIDMDDGDFADAAPLLGAQAVFGPQGVTHSVAGMLADAFAGMHDARAARAALTDANSAGTINPERSQIDVVWAHMVIDAEIADWPAVISDQRNDLAYFATAPELRVLSLARETPLLAYAYAKLGDFDSANRLIATTPDHCDICLRMRGRVSALERREPASVFWFARAVAENPNTPFAYTDWGEMLLHDGQYDAAIVKFETATKKGPHFADPLEMWGEALVAKNRSDLAAAKFAEAEKYAPKWGRLHQKWGEALSYLGRKDEAAKQFALARRL